MLTALGEAEAVVRRLEPHVASARARLAPNSPERAKLESEIAAAKQRVFDLETEHRAAVASGASVKIAQIDKALPAAWDRAREAEAERDRVATELIAAERAFTNAWNHARGLNDERARAQVVLQRAHDPRERV